MSKIELSAGIAAGVQSRILRFQDQTPTSASPAQTGLLQQGPASYTASEGRIYLMGGSVPTDTAGLTLSGRFQDILVTFSVSDGAFNDVQSGVSPAIISTLYRNASASGQANWFWMVAIDGNGVITHQIVGSVGLVGSGADLEIDNNVIVSGQQYRILNLRISFATTSWVY